MQGGLRMKINTSDLGSGEIPVFVPPPKAAPKPGGIFMFGDSTTAPRGGTKVYATRVENALQSIGSTLSVYNAGVPSNTTRDARKRLQSDVLRYQPRIVVMQFGINDSAIDVWQKPPATKSRVPVEDFIANYRALIAEAQKAKSKVILMTTNPLRWTGKLRELYGKPPYNPDVEDGFESATLALYNDAIRDLAKELKLPLVDVRAAYPEFAEKHKASIEEMLSDGMHPNDLGHQLVAELLVPVIRNALR
jgi:lysophospholipase L1-like esterase